MDSDHTVHLPGLLSGTLGEYDCSVGATDVVWGPVMLCGGH